MDFNIIVGNEMKHIASESHYDRDFRFIYHRERLKALKAKESTGKSLIRLICETKIYPSISPYIFAPELQTLIEPHLPSNFIIESTEAEIMKWNGLPSYKTILVIRPAGFEVNLITGTKEFLPWFKSNHAYCISAHQHSNAMFSFSFVTANIPKEWTTAHMAHNFIVTNSLDIIRNTFALDEELKRYEKFQEDLVNFFKKGEL